jgi:hypothetical protein
MSTSMPYGILAEHARRAASKTVVLARRLPDLLKAVSAPPPIRFRDQARTAWSYEAVYRLRSQWDAYTGWTVGRNRISMTSTSSGWEIAMATILAHGAGRHADLAHDVLDVVCQSRLGNVVGQLRADRAG